MPHVRRFDHVGITVADLDRATSFFVGLGLQVDGDDAVEGGFLDTVIGITDSRTRSSCCGRRPGDGAGAPRFIRPDHPPGSPTAMATAGSELASRWKTSRRLSTAGRRRLWPGR